MSEKYIRNNFHDIKKYANAIEQRLDDSYCTLETVLKDNKTILESCRSYGLDYVLIDDNYNINIEL